MARAISDDLREKVLAAYAAGKGTLQQLAERFDVKFSWVKKIRRDELRTGSQKRIPQRRRQSQIDGEQVRALVDQQPDIVLRELKEKLAEAGVTVSQSHLWRVLRKLGLRLKKSRSTPPSATRKRIAAGAKSSSSGSARPLRKISSTSTKAASARK